MPKPAERALALAGLIQCCYLVGGIARSGMVGEDSMTGSLSSVFVVDPEETLDVYKSGNGVRTGLRLLHEILGEFHFDEYADTIRYAYAVVQLEKKLRHETAFLGAIGSGIARISQQRSVSGESVSSPPVVRQLAEVYEETAGKLTPRIRVLGQQKHLQNETNKQRIRALLLAAIRSAVLWRQLDGRVSQLIFGRKKLLQSIDIAAEMVN